MKTKLDKEEVASRQLDTAISLMFGGGDVVSVHTLASASSTIFSDLLHAQGVKAWRDEIVECFPGQKQQVGRVLREAQNFFKHADRDRSTVLEFRPAQTKFLLLDACFSYRVLSGELLPLLQTFTLWMVLQHPDLFHRSDEIMGAVVGAREECLGRQHFFAEVLPAMEAKYEGG